MNVGDIEIGKSYIITEEKDILFEALEILPPKSKFNFTKKVLVWGEGYIKGNRKIYQKRWLAPDQLENI